MWPPQISPEQEITVDEQIPNRRQFIGGSMAAAPAFGAMLLLPGSEPAVREEGMLNVRKHGATGDGKTKDTRAIQAAIDACHAGGGGTVYFPPGIFLGGSLHLKGGVGLHLDHGATLRASEDAADFDPYETLGFKNAADRETSFFHHALLWAEDAERVAITGTGTIDGNRKRRGGPKPIALKRCKLVTIRGITIRDSPNYCISLLGTDYVNIDGVTILNGYSDGIDPDCCHHVRISNCHIESWDDSIVPKTSFSLGKRRSTENVTVTNCVLASNCNCFKLGTESGGDYRNIAVSNCTMFSRSTARPPISGISLLSVDGSTMEGVTISNIAMTDVRCPVFLRLGNRGRDMEKPIPGTIRDVLVANVTASGASWPSAVMGIVDHPVERVTFRDLRVGYKGGGTREEARAEVHEHVAKYPSADMFETYPAYGLYCRHARDLHLSGLHFRCESPDLRPAVRCDDVSRLAVDVLDAATAGDALLDFRNVQGAVVRGCAPAADTKVFLTVEGTETKAIGLLANDFSRVGKIVTFANGALPASVGEVGNRK
jgi:Glycosyl hydrolases family 28